MSNVITSPFTVFFDRSGQPLDAGYIYIGTAGINPEVSPISVYWDTALTTPAAQPIRTIAGYPSQNGSPGTIIIDQGVYSIVIRDSNGALVYSNLNASDIGNGLPQFFLDDYYSTTWEAAMNAAAAAASAAGGGIIYATRREEYAFTAKPSNLPAGVYVFGTPNFTRFKMPTTSTYGLLRWEGGLSTSYTLAANVAQGADSCTFTSVVGLTVGMLIRNTNSSLGFSLGLPTQIRRIVKIVGNVVTFSARSKFPVTTANTYTFQIMSTVSGGGAYGIIFDGSANTSLECVGIYAVYCDGMYFDEIRGESMSGLDPTSSSTSAAVISMFGCYGTRGLTNLAAYKSGCASIADIQMFGCGPAEFGNVRSELSTGFGPGWYNCTDQQVANIYSVGAYARAGKAQCTYGFQAGTITSDRPGYTSFAFTEGTEANVGSYACSRSADILRYGATIVRNANISTITYASSADAPVTSPAIVTISGATGANSFNGRVTITQTGPTTFTYANVGVNETAGGTIVIDNQENPSFWVNDTGCQVIVGSVFLYGATNTNGDIHTGNTDQVTIGAVYSQGGFTPTYAGTSGSQALSLTRRIGSINDLTYLATPAFVQAHTSTGAVIMQGQDFNANPTWNFNDLGLFTPKASATASAGFRWVTGPAPTSPTDGDMWREDNTLTGVKIRIAGVTHTFTIT